MDALAIVCEYNPFHSGHAYHIQAAKELCNADTVIGVMSGCFVQRAEPAVLSPVLRAETALHNGMDAVIELPVAFSCAVGERFADGAMRIMSRIPQIKWLAIGVEDDGNLIQRIADIQFTQPPVFCARLQEVLQKGKPYAVALTEATAAAIDTSLCEAVKAALQKPNNVLAVEYLRSIRRHDLSIVPVFVQRSGNHYNDTAACGQHISATAARILLEKGDFHALRPYIPHPLFSVLCESYERQRVHWDIYEALTVHALRTKDIAQSADNGEGLHYKLSECARKYVRLTDIVEACKSKRYTVGRIKRICLQTLLGITDEVMQQAEGAAGRLIAVKNARKDILRALSGIAVQNNDYAALGDAAVAAAQTDGTAGSIYSLITQQPNNAFWDRKLLTV